MHIVAENYIPRNITFWEIVCVFWAKPEHIIATSPRPLGRWKEAEHTMLFPMEDDSCSILVSNFSYIVKSHPASYYFYN